MVLPPNSTQSISPSAYGELNNLHMIIQPKARWVILNFFTLKRIKELTIVQSYQTKIWVKMETLRDTAGISVLCYVESICQSKRNSGKLDMCFMMTWQGKWTKVEVCGQ